jgi:hypothetical protein
MGRFLLAPQDRQNCRPIELALISGNLSDAVAGDARDYPALPNLFASWREAQSEFLLRR